MMKKLPPGQFYGAVSTRRELPNLILSETCYYQDLKIPPHSHEQAYFGITLQGAYTQAYGLKSRTCRPQMIAFHPPDETHSAHFPASAVRSFNVEIKSHWLEQLRRSSILLPEPVDFHGGAMSWLALKIYREYQHMDELSPLAIEGIALEMMVEASRRSAKISEKKPPLWLTRAKEAIQAEFDQAVALSDLAALVGVHPVYLASEFRKHYHCSIGEYQRKLRVEFACRELATSDTPIVEVALAAGFSHQGHFSTVFRRLTGMTPTEFRSTSRIP